MLDIIKIVSLNFETINSGINNIKKRNHATGNYIRKSANSAHSTGA